MKVAFPALALSLGVLGVAARPVNDTGARVNFNREVRPILSEHCFKCHGPDAATAAGGVRLDTMAEAIKRAIRPGDPDLSRLMMRVAHSDAKLRMPPASAGMKPLTPEQIDVLRRWIAQGAKYESHWSFVPPKRPTVPSVRKYAWCRNLVDRFVLSGIERAGFEPEREADRETLAMRAALTLTGLPPTETDWASYRADRTEGAYERLVDRLLASPRYGEHQARYWLDAVRYGDTHGLHLDNERGIFPFRDWVVRAFNRDLPFDQFTEWQIAGDLLPKPTREMLVATGYVRMNPTTAEGGAIEEEFLAKNTFDRVDTTSTVFLGLTVACARCHDHKYDPIPQKDYYRLFAYFNSTTDKPLDDNALLPAPAIRATTDEEERRLSDMDADLAAQRSRVAPAEAQAWLLANRAVEVKIGKFEVSETYKAANFDEAHAKAYPGEPGVAEPAKWRPLDLKLGQDAVNVANGDNSAAYLKGTLTTAEAQTIDLGVSSDDGVKLWLNGKLVHDNKALRGVTTAVDQVKVTLKVGANELVAKVSNGGGQSGFVLRVGDERQARIDRALEAQIKAPTEPDTLEELRRLYLEAGPETPEAKTYRERKKLRDDFEAALPMTLIAQEREVPRETRVLRRGEYHLPSERVGRAIPAALGKLPGGLPNNRLGFAKWLTSRENPLTARVFVNRVWQQHFGTGIVKTAEDFGSQGEWPANPELLDFLALEFMQGGWSVKRLHRMIVTSAAFRQSSRLTEEKKQRDPENRLITRGPRFRLDAEVIRDRALAAGGLLVEKPGGKGFKPYQPDGLWEAIAFDSSNTAKYVRDQGEAIYKRSLYLFWKRTSPHPVMLNFDAPMREMCTVRRFRTNTPLQALTTLNEPAFLEASRAMAARVIAAPIADRIEAAYRIALGRDPRPDEVRLVTAALERYRAKYAKDPASAEKLLTVGDSPRPKQIPVADHAAWMLVCSTLINTDEFLTQH